MILCWGDVGYDDYAGEDAPRPGGCALNVAWSVVEAGGEAGVAGPVGEDGPPLLDLARRKGIDVTGMEVLQGASARQRIRLGKNGERELCGHRGGVLLSYAPGPVARKLLAEAELVYLPLWDTTLPWLELLLELRPQKPIAVDLMDLSDVGPAHSPLIERASIVFAGVDEADADARAVLKAHAAKTGALTVVTLGAGGSEIHYPPMPPLRNEVLSPPDPLVDTTGCGDAFAGAFLAIHLATGNASVALTVASGQAAHVATHRGAIQTPI